MLSKNIYSDTFGDEILVVQLMLFRDVALGEFGQFNHFRNDFLFIVGIAEID